MGPISNRQWFYLLALLFYWASVCLAHNEQDNKRIERRLRNIEDSIAEERLQRREDVQNILDKLTGLGDMMKTAFGGDHQDDSKLNEKDEDWIGETRVTKIFGSLAHAFSREKQINLRFRREVEEMIRHQNNECSSIPEIIDKLDVMERSLDDIVNAVKGVAKYTDMAAEHFATKADLSEATKRITDGQIQVAGNILEKVRQSQNLTEMQNTVLGRLETSLLNITYCGTNIRKVISENGEIENEENSIKKNVEKDESPIKKNVEKDKDESPIEEKLFGSCSELYAAGFTTSGVYKITVKDRFVDVYCDQTTDGGGWIVFQRRQDGSEDFNRNWDDFKHGFGDLEGEFWLGNENLADMTEKCCPELRIDIADFDGNKVYAKYKNFSVLPESTLYQLKVGIYTGNAGDAMHNHNNMKFSTVDSDNDKSIRSVCTELYPGGWWHNECYRAHLNGNYHKYGKKKSQGLHWLEWEKYYSQAYSLKFSEMKIR